MRPTPLAVKSILKTCRIFYNDCLKSTEEMLLGRVSLKIMGRTRAGNY